MKRIIVEGRLGEHQRDIIYNPDGISPAINGVGCEGGTTINRELSSMRTDRIVVGGQLDIPGWHNKAKEVLETYGICTCIHAQSNNLLQKIIIYENSRTIEPVP